MVSSLPRSFRPRFSAFTIVELIVVITIIALVLAIAVPGLSKMASEAKFSSAVQTINGALARAYYSALSDRTMTAVRFTPGAWELDKSGQLSEVPDRQYLVTYQYSCITQGDEREGEQVTDVKYRERFQRRKESAAVELPADVWAAPIEADDELASKRYGGKTLGETTLAGQIGQFEENSNNQNADNQSKQFLNSDDFMVVFDPQTGLRSGPVSANSNTWPQYRLFAPALANNNSGKWEDSDEVRRFGFTGIVLYDRTTFRALGASAAGKDRQTLLRRYGRPYFVHRYSGALVMGNQETQ